MTSTQLAGGRSDVVDALRGICVLFVLGLHISVLVPFKGAAVAQLLPTWSLKFLFRNGHYGVVMFFVISGFLIASTSIRRWGSLAEIDAAEFYRNRLARLAPTFLLLVGLLILLDQLRVPNFVVGGGSSENPSSMGGTGGQQAASLHATVLSTFGLYMNWLDAHYVVPDAWGVLWSLSVEELFYLFFPVFALILPRAALVAGLLFLVALGPFARTDPQANLYWQGHSYLSCMGEIALGVLAAMATRRGETRAQKAGLLTAGAAACLFVLACRQYDVFKTIKGIGLDSTLLAAGTSLVLAAGACRPLRNPVARAALKPLAFCGRRCYEIYMTHMVVIGLIVPRFGAPEHRTTATWLASAGLLLFGSILVGHLTHVFFSQPLERRIRRRSRHHNESSFVEATQALEKA